MLHKQRYFDRNGCEVAEHEAMGHEKVLRDGFSLRIPTTLRDSTRLTDGRAFWDQHRDSLLVVDARRIGGTEGNKPGFRVFDNDVGRAEREAAYAQAEAYLREAWRNGATAGAYPYTTAAEGSACTVDGRPGRLVKEGNALVCSPISADAAKPPRDPEEDDDDEDDDDGKESATSDLRMLDVSAVSAAHQRAMDAIYRQISEDVSQQWRRGK